jgi:hypothetical protein
MDFLTFSPDAMNKTTFRLEIDEKRRSIEKRIRSLPREKAWVKGSPTKEMIALIAEQRALPRVEEKEFRSEGRRGEQGGRIEARFRIHPEVSLVDEILKRTPRDNLCKGHK